MKREIVRPNIFKISTKELSQDAFIVWLIQWADPRYVELDVTLHECGKSFLKMVMGSSNQSDEKQILRIEAGRQWDYIDVWAEIYFVDGSKTLLVIEDKTFTGEHSGQLERYKKQADDFCVENNFNLICTYFKIGSEPLRTINSIKEKGFNIVTRKEIIEALQPYRDADHSILRDFIEYIDDLEKAHAAFEHIPPNEWKDLAWVGFYQYVESNIKISNWHWVNNPGGGFWNLNLNWDYWNRHIPVYMQIEEQRLCFKIALGKDETGLDNARTNITAIQNYVYNTLITFASNNNMHIVRRPGRLSGRGDYRTLAVIDLQDWCGVPDELVNKEQVIVRLRGILLFYQQFMNYLNTVSFEAAGIKVVEYDEEQEGSITNLQ